MDDYIIAKLVGVGHKHIKFRATEGATKKDVIVSVDFEDTYLPQHENLKKYQPTYQVDQKVGPWSLQKLLGFGASSEVWQAVDKNNKNQYALKIYKADIDDPNLFSNEVNLLRALNEVDGIINYIDHDSDEKWICIQLAETLFQSLQAENIFQQIFSMLYQIVSTLSYLLSIGICYEDMVFDNIVFDGEHYVLIDLEKARFIKHNEDKAKLVKSTVYKVVRVMLEIRQNFLDKFSDESSTEVHNFLQLMFTALTSTRLDKMLISLEQIQESVEPTEFPAREETIKKLIEFFPANPNLLVKAGVLFRQINDFKQAQNYLEQAIELKPKFFLAYELLGQVKQAIRFKQYTEQAMTDCKQQVKQGAMSAETKQQLSKPFNVKAKLIASSGNKLFYQGKLDEDQISSFDLISWDQYFTDLSFGGYRMTHDGERRAWRERTLHYFVKNVAIIERILRLKQAKVNLLDIGCASGYLLRFLEGNYSHVDTQKLIYYWGLDIRSSVLYRAMFSQNDIESSATCTKIPGAFIAHDVAFGLPYVDDYFDVIVNFEMIKYLNIEVGVKLIQEISRVLKPGGHLYFSTTRIPSREGYIESLPFDEVAQEFKKANLVIKQTFGGQRSLSNFYDDMSVEDQATAKRLLQFHPPQIVSAILAPLQIKSATQIIYFCEKT